MKKQFQALALIAILSATCSQSQAAEQRHLKSVGQPDGKTLHLSNDIAEPLRISITRVHADNYLDITFGTAGTVTLDLSHLGANIQDPNVVIHNIQVTRITRRITITLGIDNENYVIKLNNDGTLNPEFGVGGILFLDDEEPSEEAPDPFA